MKKFLSKSLLLALLAISASSSSFAFGKKSVAPEGGKPASWEMQISCSTKTDGGEQFEVYVTVVAQGTYNTPTYKQTYVNARLTQLDEKGHETSSYTLKAEQFSLIEQDSLSYVFRDKLNKRKLSCYGYLNGAASGSN